MRYYKTNAIYENLSQTKKHSFVWASGNAWALIYSDNQNIPKALVLAWGRSWAIQKNLLTALQTISKKSGLPLVYVNFDDQATSILDVNFGTLGHPPASLSLIDLKDRFKKMGLPVSTGVCGKSINDATSSAFHKWQRENLGSINATDIDLIRLDQENIPIEIIELKRSYYALDEWRPYPEDFVNFNLLLNVCDSADINLNIAYNVRQTKPKFNDDASRVAIFQYRNANSPVSNGEYDFDDFIKGVYL